MSDTYWVKRFDPGKLRELRWEINRWSKAELARRVGKAPETIRKYENGSRTPGFDALHALTQVFGVDVLDLLHDDTEVDLPIYRLRAGLRQTDVSAVLGMSRPTYRNIEARVTRISPDKVAPLAKALRVDERVIKPFLDIRPEKPPSPGKS